jgi:hypothetical protein
MPLIGRRGRAVVDRTSNQCAADHGVRSTQYLLSRTLRMQGSHLCTGKNLSFSARRDGKPFSIEIVAANGELAKVQRVH